jgi:hypothetical protein
MLIGGKRHLRAFLEKYVAHYNVPVCIAYTASHHVGKGRPGRADLA